MKKKNAVMPRELRTLMLVLFLLLTNVVCIANAAELRIEKTLTQADGLASNRVLSTFKDPQGMMWFGTTDGITRYDGERFDTFTTEDGLASNIVDIIFEDRRGVLWFGTGKSLSVLRKENAMDMSLMEMPLSELAKMSQEETRKKIIPVQATGVTSYDRSRFQIFTTADGLLGNTIRDIFEDEAGTLWFATNLGVSRYNGERFNNLIMEAPMGMNILPNSWNSVKVIAQDRAGNFWFGNEAGISYYNIETALFRYFAVDEVFEPFGEMAENRPGHVNALHFDTEDRLWIAKMGVYQKDSGIRRYDGKDLVNFPTSEELPMNEINSILQDSRGNLWFAGVKETPQILQETEDGRRMVGGEAEGSVSVYNGKTFQNFTAADGLPHGRIWAVFEAMDGKLWFATDAGAAVGVYLPSQNLDN